MLLIEEVEVSAKVAQEMFNPEVDEATATAFAIILHNQIEVLQAWERKLRGPFLPTTKRHMQLVPDYPKPTVATVLHMINDDKRFELEVSRLLVKYVGECRGRQSAE